MQIRPLAGAAFIRPSWRPDSSWLQWSGQTFLICLSTAIPTEGMTQQLLPQPNVLMIVVDDLKPTIGAFGDPVAVTPNLDRLANEGAIFTRAYCQMALCSPSRISVLTGLRPDSTGVFDLNMQIRDALPEVTTLPQHFAEYGYTTHGISKIFHHLGKSGQDEQLSWTDGWVPHGVIKRYFEPGKSEIEDAALLAGTPPSSIKISATDRGIATDAEHGDGAAAEKGVAKIRAYAADFHENGDPFFLAIGFQKPHLPLNAPDKYWALYDDVDFGLNDYDAIMAPPKGAPFWARPFSAEPGNYDDGWPVGVDGVKVAPTTTEAENLVHAYYACTSFIDAQVGKLLDALEDEAIAEDTIVIVWSDHGWHLGDHGAFWSKHSNYEQATRSVLMIKAPGVAQPGSVISSPTELVDIFPTLCQLTGLPLPDHGPIGKLEGQGLEPLLRDPFRPGRKAAFSQYQRSPGGGLGLLMGYSMRTHRYRLTSWMSRGKLTDVSSQTDVIRADELYDYHLAPEEPRNLIHDPSYSEVVSTLYSVMLGDRWNNPRIAQPDGDPRLLTPISVWKDAYLPFGSSPAELDDLSDVDGDGIRLGLEYTFGYSPLVREPQLLLLSPDITGTTVSISFPAPLSRPDYVPGLEWSHNLENWFSEGLTISSDVTGDEATTSWTLPPESLPIFFRLAAIPLEE